MSNLTDLSEQLTAAILQGDGTTALDLFADYAERANTMMVTLARDLRHMTEERDAISSAWDELAAAGWRSVKDNSPAPLEPVVIDTYDGVDVGWRLPEVPHLWITRRGRSYLTEEIRGVLAIPAPPQE